MNVARQSSIAASVLVAVVLALFAFAIFGPLTNLLLWAFAEKWYFPSKLPSEFGFTFWQRVFSPRGAALASLGTSVWIAVLTVVVSLAVAIPAGYALALTSDGERLYAVSNASGKIAIVATKDGTKLGELKIPAFGQTIIRIDSAR